METETPIKARVVADHEPSDPEPLVMKAGEKLKIGDRDTTWPAYVRCRDNLGNEGWVPALYLEINGKDGVALVDYSAAELTVRIGDVLLLEKEVGGWYWASTEMGEWGWIPVEHVQKLTAET